MLRSRLAWFALLAAGFAGSLAACAQAEGSVEIRWVLVDANLERIFPGDAANTSCALEDWLRARGPAGPHTRVAARVRLLGYECADTATTGDGQTFPCPAAEPIIDERFDCALSGAVVTRIPALDDAIVWVMQVEVDDGTGAALVASDRCISIPGPRQRKIVPGSITDLELYQLVVHATRDAPLELTDCS